MQPQIGVAILVKWQDKYLFSRRISTHENDRYGVPGGKLDFGESIVDCAKRELFEETQLIAKSINLTGYMSNNVYVHSHFLCIWFEATLDVPENWDGVIDYIETDIKGNPKSHGWKWYTLKEALDLPLMCSTETALLHENMIGESYDYSRFVLDHKKADN